MSFVEIADIVLAVACVAIYAVKIYFKIRGNVFEAASELIALAEGTGLDGAEKMALVVEELYNCIPAWLKKIFSRDDLQNIAQGVFNWMKQYAIARAEKKTVGVGYTNGVFQGDAGETLSDYSDSKRYSGLLEDQDVD